MKKIIIIFVLILSVFTLNTIDIAAANGKGQVEDTSFTYETTRSFYWSDDTYTVRYWVSARIFTGGPIFIKYETENIVYEKVSISSNAIRSDRDYIHNEKQQVIILMPELFFNTILYTENRFPYIIVSLIFENEESRHTHVSMLWLDHYSGEEYYEKKLDRYEHYLERHPLIIEEEDGSR